MESPLKNKILLVEDDVLQIYIAKKILSEKFEVLSVTNGYEAFRAMENHQIDLVLMDINLGDPGMDGVKVTQQLRDDKRFKCAKIVALTSFSHMRETYAAEGFNGIIVKPIKSDTIFDLLENVSNTDTACCLA